jgi:hypothetical protein
MAASAMARTTTCIATPPSRLLTASGALPEREAVPVVAISGSEVMPPSRMVPTIALLSPVRSESVVA